MLYSVKLYNRHQAVKPQNQGWNRNHPSRTCFGSRKSSRISSTGMAQCPLRTTLKLGAKRISSGLTVRTHRFMIGPRVQEGMGKTSLYIMVIWMYLTKLNSKVTGSLRAGLITCTSVFLWFTLYASMYVWQFYVEMHDSRLTLAQSYFLLARATGLSVLLRRNCIYKFYI